MPDTVEKMSQVPRPFIEVRNGSKQYGAVQALVGVDFHIQPGEIVGLVGHNGAGKSTLINVLTGTTQRSSGELLLRGQPVDRWSPANSLDSGLRCVFQELSLCDTLTAAENIKVVHRSLGGFAWRRRAAKLLVDKLEEIFPNHGIPLGRPVGELAIGHRQMIEIARAFTQLATAPSCVILDEPTSSLGHDPADQLLAYMKRAASEGVASILVTHRLNEILAVCDRVVIMKDGRVVGEKPNVGLTRTDLVEAMGNIERRTERKAISSTASSVPLFEHAGCNPADLAITVAPGEIVGFAGLDGHGQRERLRAMFYGSSSRYLRERRPGPAFVAGDRVLEGVFPLWSVGDNLTIRTLPGFATGGLLDTKRLRTLAIEWFQRLKIRAPSLETPIVSLSGGNQQKIVFARALCSDAQLIFLDDPMRGVDVGTKQEVYELIRHEAEKGRSFVWYTTEIDELDNCQRIYVFREGNAATLLTGEQASQSNIMQASFGVLS